MLTTNNVAEIKSCLTLGDTQAAVAGAYGVSRSTISDIATGRIWKAVPWPKGCAKKAAYDPTNDRILELEAEIVHLTEERNRERARVKAGAKTAGLFRAIVDEMETRIKPFAALPAVRPTRKSSAIHEHCVMHVSDGHHDQVISPDECGNLERYDFPISCARAEHYVDTVIKWTQQTLSAFDFDTLWIPCYGDHSSGEIHGHGPRSYYRNQFKNCLAIGQLHGLMFRDLAPYFKRVNVIYLSGNHGRRTPKKDYHGAQDNFDYLIAETARLHCRSIDNIKFLIPNAWSINIRINGVGFNFCHGDDVPGNGGIPFYGMTRRQKGLTAIGSMTGQRVRYSVMGHHHIASSLADFDGELIVNGAWAATDSYTYNRFTSYREPMQLLHGVTPKYGITWRLPVKLRHAGEAKGPKRYLIDGGRDVGPHLL